jgi:hydrogenase nickel incorporation protein HypA/HybF
MRSRQRSITPVHELAICQAVLSQVLAVASSRNARHIGRVTLRIGPLAGVEPQLLVTAFPIVAAGTPAEGAFLEIEDAPVQVRCQVCGSTSDALPNRLLCGACGGWRVALVAGDEMLLARVELLDAPSLEPEDRIHV